MLKECHMISAFRRNKNLKDILVHTAFNNENDRKKEVVQPVTADMEGEDFPVFSPFPNFDLGLAQMWFRWGD